MHEKVYYVCYTHLLCRLLAGKFQNESQAPAVQGLHLDMNWDFSVFFETDNYSAVTSRPRLNRDRKDISISQKS